MIKYEDINEDYSIFIKKHLPLKSLVIDTKYRLYDRLFNEIYTAVYTGYTKDSKLIYYRFNLIDYRESSIDRPFKFFKESKASYGDIWFLRRML